MRYIALFQVESGYVIIIKKINDISEIFRQFSKVNLPMGITQSHVRIQIFPKKMFGLSLTTNMPKKTLIFRKRLKVSNLIPYPYPARIFG